MNSINPVNVDKSAEYHNNLQTAFRERIGAKEENSSLFSNALGDGPAIKVEISSLGAEMSEKVKNGEMPEGAIKQLERTPLTEKQLKSVKHGSSGEEILVKMKETDPKAYKEYEEIKAKRVNGGKDQANEEAKFIRVNGGKDQANEEARFITMWAMRYEMPQLSCWEIMDKKKAGSQESIMSGDKSELR